MVSGAIDETSFLVFSANARIGNFIIVIIIFIMNECVGFNVPLNTLKVISETSFSRQSIALVLTTRNNHDRH